MPERTVTVASRVGLHARPAALLAEAAARAGLPVTISSAAGRSVDAASILGVLSLGVDHGDTVTIAAEGAGAEAALDTLEALLRTDLDAE
ncbi:MAG: HPr family phosphocarrier protein [Microbacteriaceae bacterium]